MYHDIVSGCWQVWALIGEAEVKEFLRAMCDDPHLSLCRHKGLWNVQRQIFRPDMVHLTGGTISCSAASKGRCLVLENWCININK